MHVFIMNGEVRFLRAYVEIDDAKEALGCLPKFGNTLAMQGNRFSEDAITFLIKNSPRNLNIVCFTENLSVVDRICCESKRVARVRFICGSAELQSTMLARMMALPVHSLELQYFLISRVPCLVRPNLRVSHLELCGRLHLSDREIDEFLSLFPNLSEVELVGEAVTPPVLAAIARRPEPLEVLDVERVSENSQQDLFDNVLATGARCIRLGKLFGTGTVRRTTTVVERRCKTLNPSVDSNVLEAIASAPHLAYALVCPRLPLTVEGMRRKAKVLKHLTVFISNSPLPLAEEFEDFEDQMGLSCLRDVKMLLHGSFPQLRHLTVMGRPSTDAMEYVITRAKTFPRLRRLTFQSGYYRPEIRSSIIADLFEAHPSFECFAGPVRWDTRLVDTMLRHRTAYIRAQCSPYGNPSSLRKLVGEEHVKVLRSLSTDRRNKAAAWERREGLVGFRSAVEGLGRV
jgi:hypothetical protein